MRWNKKKKWFRKAALKSQLPVLTLSGDWKHSSGLWISTAVHHVVSGCRCGPACSPKRRRKPLLLRQKFIECPVCPPSVDWGTTKRWRKQIQGSFQIANKCYMNTLSRNWLEAVIFGRAIRESGYELHVEILTKIVFRFFAQDHTSARWMSIRLILHPCLVRVLKGPVYLE